MERLFHVSEEPQIDLFEPRPHKDGGSYVWAIGETRLHNYLLPRDCPRISYFAASTTTPEDAQHFLGSTEAETVIAIEKQWISRLLTTTLFVYEFDSNGFRLKDEIASYYVSEESTRPIAQRVVNNILEELLCQDIELRIMSSLWALREAVIHSSLGFSIIRMRNALPTKSVKRYSI